MLERPGGDNDLHSSAPSAAIDLVVPERRVVDEGRADLPLAEWADATDHIARPSFGLRRIGHGRPLAACGGGDRFEIESGGDRNDADRVGGVIEGDHQGFEDVIRIDTQRLDRLLAERPVARIVVVLDDAVIDPEAAKQFNSRCHGSMLPHVPEITLRGNPIQVDGDLPPVGTSAPDFTLIKADWSPLHKGDLAGQGVILNIFPSIDTRTCQKSVRAFNERAAALDNTIVVCVSADLPPAAARFCGAEGIENVVTGSTFRSPDLLRTYGVLMTDGVMAALAARAVVVLDRDGVVVHTELVMELTEEPDYDAAIAALG